VGYPFNNPIFYKDVTHSRGSQFIQTTILPNNDKFGRTVFLVIQTHIYLPEDISSRHTSPAGMNYFRMNGIEQ